MLGFAAVGPVVAAGRSGVWVGEELSADSTGRGAAPGQEVDMSVDLPENVQRWTAKRRAALVISILQGETSSQEAARKHDLTVAEIEQWKERFLSGAENALRSRPIATS